jgi:hypothetical protein
VVAVRAVDEAVPRDETEDDRLLEVRLDTVVVARYVWLDTERLVVDALPSIVCPVTVKVLVVRAPVKEAVLP